MFELDRRTIVQGRVKPLAVIDLFKEPLDRTVSIGQIAVFLAVDLFVFQSLHERFAGGVVAKDFLCGSY